jgi:periplasmic mercuric ion binding protein
MKHIIFSVLFSVITFLCFAQNKNISEQTIKVTGLCGDCKERIETAADIKGVKSAVWTAETQSLKVIFRNDKTTIDKIKQSIAAVGYDTEELKGNEKAYQKLPTCCKYRSTDAEKQEHNK